MVFLRLFLPPLGLCGFAPIRSAPLSFFFPLRCNITPPYVCAKFCFFLFLFFPACLSFFTPPRPPPLFSLRNPSWSQSPEILAPPFPFFCWFLTLLFLFFSPHALHDCPFFSSLIRVAPSILMVAAPPLTESLSHMVLSFPPPRFRDCLIFFPPPTPSGLVRTVSPFPFLNTPVAGLLVGHSPSPLVVSTAVCVER